MAGKIRQIWGALEACFKANKEPLTKAQVLAWIGNNFRDADFNSNTVIAQLRRSCINVAFAQKYKAPKILIYDDSNETYSLVDEKSAFQTGAIHDKDALGVARLEDDENESESTFALEAHLRDYLARNLSSLEKGLKLWCDSPPSVEYPIDGRRIDLLAKDIEGNPVVIELKLNKGYDRVVGQALLYQGLISTKLGHSRVRIILVAGDISFELKTACSRLTDVELFEYAITMKLEKVSSVVSEEEVQDGSFG